MWRSASEWQWWWWCTDLAIPGTIGVVLTGPIVFDGVSNVSKEPHVRHHFGTCCFPFRLSQLLGRSKFSSSLSFRLMLALLDDLNTRWPINSSSLYPTLFSAEFERKSHNSPCPCDNGTRSPPALTSWTRTHIIKCTNRFLDGYCLSKKRNRNRVEGKSHQNQKIVRQTLNNKWN